MGPGLRHTPAPNAQPTLWVYNQSCRAKQSESTGKTAGASCSSPIQRSRRTGPGPESSDYMPHNERPGSAGSAALSLALSHTHAHRQTDPPHAALLLKSRSAPLCSVPFAGLPGRLTFASAAALGVARAGRGGKRNPRPAPGAKKLRCLFSFTATVGPK